MHIPVMFFRCSALFLLELNISLCSFLSFSQYWPFPQIPGTGSLFSRVLLQLSLVIECPLFFPERLLIQTLGCFSNTSHFHVFPPLHFDKIQFYPSKKLQ